MTPSPEYLIALMSVSAIAVLLAVWCFRMTRKENSLKRKNKYLAERIDNLIRSAKDDAEICDSKVEEIQRLKECNLDLGEDRDRVYKNYQTECREGIELRAKVKLLESNSQMADELIINGNRLIAAQTPLVIAQAREIDLLKTFLKHRAPEVCTFIHKPEKYKAWLGKIAATRGKKEHPSGISDKDIKRIGKALDKFDAALKSNNPYEMYVNTEFPPTHVPPAGPHRGFSTHNDLQTKAEHTLAGVRAKNGKGLGALLNHQKTAL